MTTRISLSLLIVTNSVLVSSSLPCGAAVIQNPEFSDVPKGAGWTLTVGAEVVRDGGFNFAYGNGGYSLAINAGTVTNASYLGAYQLIPTNPGDKWTFKGWVFHSNNEQLSYAAASAKISFPNGTVFSTGDLAATYDNQWDEFTVSGETPAGVNGLTFSLLVRRWDNPSGRVFFDHISAEVLQGVPEPSTVWAIIGVALPVLWHLSHRCFRAQRGWRG
jgi:hypothetical protein